MKHIYKFVAMLLIILAWSCGDDDNMDAVGGWTIAEPALTAPAANATLTLNEATPAAKTRFEWNAAAASNKFVVAYTVILVPAEATTFDKPLLSVTPGNAGKNLFAEVTAQQIDYALWTACYPAGAQVKLKWAVVAKAIEQSVVASQNITVTRFATEYFPSALYITGDAAEAGGDITKATPMRAQKDGNGKLTYVFDVYTTLTKGGTFSFRDKASVQSRIYGGKDQNLVPCGDAITAPETGQYRVTVDLVNNKYSLAKIDQWSVIGEVTENPWNVDLPLTYIGNSVWAAKLDLLQPSPAAQFIFRANGEWTYILKRIQGTENKILLESDAAAAGLKVENIPSKDAGTYTVTLNLQADKYTYALVADPSTQPAKPIIGDTKSPDADAVNGGFTLNATVPATLFLVSEGQSIGELTKTGNKFSSVTYLPLQQSKTYQLNTKADGSGTVVGEASLTVARDQAYLITADFDAKKFNWKYYNMKLFHWDNANWEGRKELLMSYIHPFKFTGTFDLMGGYVSKFNSPWEVQFGTADTALSGTMQNSDKSPNYSGIVQDGKYTATIVVAPDYSSCTYSFVK